MIFIKTFPCYSKFLRWHSARFFRRNSTLWSLWHYSKPNKKQYFSLDELNHEMRAHNYGTNSVNKSLDDITSQILQKHKLQCSSAEMQTFFLHFATIIGHKVNHGTKEWKLYIVLRDILEIIFAKTIVKRAHELSADLAHEHHESFLACFLGQTLKPKHHKTVHHPSVMFMIGPLAFISSMRYESYHKKFKNVARTTNCRINLLKTFAKEKKLIPVCQLFNYLRRQCYSSKIWKTSRSGLGSKSQSII